MSNYRGEYVNRVLFLTDGRGSSTGLYEMAESYHELGSGISTIGLGKDFDLELVRTLARRGGGSSRFIAGRETMEEVFGTGLSRMIMPVVEDVELEPASRDRDIMDCLGGLFEEMVLAEQELALSDLVDTSKAVRVGRLLSADYMLTGTVVEMSGSVVIFGRIINVETSAIESVGQVIVPRNRELDAML